MYIAFIAFQLQTAIQTLERRLPMIPDYQTLMLPVLKLAAQRELTNKACVETGVIAPFPSPMLPVAHAECR